jgi:hypothetical protein
MINVSKQRSFRAGGHHGLQGAAKPTWSVEVCVPNRLRTCNRRIGNPTACFIGVRPEYSNRSDRSGLARRWYWTTSSALPTVSTSVSLVPVPICRRKRLVFENASSRELRNGEYGDR